LETASPHRKTLRDILVVGWSHVGQHAFTAGLGVAIPFVIVGLHTNYAVVGILLSIASICGSALQALAIIVRRASARTLLTVQNIGSTVGAITCALAPGIFVFCAGRLLQSSFGWPQHPVGSSYLTDRHPDQRGKILSWHVTAGNVGTLIAPFAIGGAIAAFGWRAGFWVLAAILATTAIVTAVWLPVSWHRLVALAPDSPHETFRSGLRRLLAQPPVLALLIAGVVAAGGQGLGIVGVYTPSFLRSDLHMSIFTLSAILTVLYVGAVIGPILMGTIADRLDHRGVLLVNYLLGALGLASFVVAGKNPLVLSLIGLCIGIFSYSELSLRQTVFSDYLPEGLARAGFGIFFTVSQSLGAIWVAIIGIIVDRVGFKPAFYTMAATFVAAAIIVALGTRRKPANRVAS